jgi:hypothetical protein
MGGRKRPGVHPTQLRDWVLAGDPRHAFPGHGHMPGERQATAVAAITSAESDGISIVEAV